MIRSRQCQVRVEQIQHFRAMLASPAPAPGSVAEQALVEQFLQSHAGQRAEMRVGQVGKPDARGGPGQGGHA
ncbi:hypothetical protein D3C83_197460 [compost metagenome]